ncbi:MAG: arsenic resistance N-acetyltransferase ArsN2 [Acidobacteria bacterium]|nr:arsenic resistance N-acetyltransferase ArsN2 [Acidobacteriota bacterium]MCA1609422.1 arsenic resistance N-acetyltransferase ArsN2 [Acidobacteriota bacterium]
MDTTPSIQPAVPADYDGVVELLTAARLPIQGLSSRLPHALVARDSGGRLAGCVALEVYGPVALLRSLAVSPERRGQGLGERLAGEALKLAAGAGARDVYLLTETAAGFFPRFGFATEDRSLAPEPLRASAEFLSACPATATLMHARVRG